MRPINANESSPELPTANSLGRVHHGGPGFASGFMGRVAHEASACTMRVTQRCTRRPWVPLSVVTEDAARIALNKVRNFGRSAHLPTIHVLQHAGQFRASATTVSAAMCW